LHGEGIDLLPGLVLGSDLKGKVLGEDEVLAILLEEVVEGLLKLRVAAVHALFLQERDRCLFAVRLSLLDAEPVVFHHQHALLLHLEHIDVLVLVELSIQLLVLLEHQELGDPVLEREVVQTQLPAPVAFKIVHHVLLKIKCHFRCLGVPHLLHQTQFL
jgi:hypothetical protein